MCSLGISRISGVSSSESSGRTTSSINTNNGDGISGGSSQVGQIQSGEEGGHRLCDSSSRSVGNDPLDGPSSGIGPSQTQIIDMVGVIWSESTAREMIGEIDWCSGNWSADRVGV